MKKAENYISEWCDITYGGGKELGDWNTSEVMKFANDFADQQTAALKEQHEKDMHLNMQYYMEYCLNNEYVTPQEWIKTYKHY